MTMSNTARARHRADVRPTTFLSSTRLSSVARRGTLGVATAGLAFGLVAPGASASEPAGGPSDSQGGGSASVSAEGGGTGSGGAESGTTVTVSAGDTVGEIAAANGSSVSSIIDANGLGANALIFVGDELTIPGGSGSSTESSSVDGAGSSGGEVEEEASSSSGSSASNDILDVARQYIGTPYVWGGSSPSGFDCSGFTQYVFAQVGIDLPRTTDAQRNAGQVVSAAEAQPGDLVWAPGHVGIYTGDGQHIAARNPGTPLEEGPIWIDNPTFIRVA
ncbi:LysM peptidoglycan-binding domain-containing C40 family peptidase [Ruania zhangjianzhongii]|uniref:C40 family peptidase n=1 Tax=Ruania zhangjianzhongii TaxID=2603206 RepID=UPI001F30DD81|nr:LysM peptidoglycan-binding domain-containing C40 family peptidase [Ruania zhangjianzhongii]